MHDRRALDGYASLNTMHLDSTRSEKVIRAVVAGSGPGRRMMITMKAPRAAARRHLPDSPFAPPAPAPPAETFAVRDQVTHDKYGLGVILSVDDHAVLVDFRSHQRRIPLPCAKLTKL